MPWDKWFKDCVPTILPSNYEIMESHDYENGISWKGRDYRGTFTILMSGKIEKDGKKWIHVSVARPDKLPEWNLLKEIKRIFIGFDRQAIQILPREKNYINMHPYCLHLFCCVDEADPVPDFVTNGMI